MIAVAGASLVAPRHLVRPFAIAGAVCAVLPDLDAIGRSVPGFSGDLEFVGGHRGFTHSLLFAGMLGLVVGFTTCVSPLWQGYRARLAIFIAAATAAHGALDAVTTIGEGIQFFSPLSLQRYTSWWKPIRGPFSELFLCLLPLIVVTRVVCHVRGVPWPRRRKPELVTIALR